MLNLVIHYHAAIIRLVETVLKGRVSLWQSSSGNAFPACRLLPSWIAELCPEPRHRGGAEYELIATVLHHGKTPSAGHYTADVRQRDGKWLRFDDADLSYVPADRVINDARAYLLFYQLRA